VGDEHRAGIAATCPVNAGLAGAQEKILSRNAMLLYRLP
jgi:hypothetical protein